MKLSERAMAVRTSSTLAITALAKKMKEEGIDVIGFGAGEPDFDTPFFIKEAAKKSIDEGYTKYTPAAGSDELKRVVCEKFKKDNNIEYDASEVIISCGAKHVLYNIFQSICDPGDEVIIPAPYWVSYPEQVGLAGGVPIYLKTPESNQFKLDPEKLRDYITPRTKALIINSPNNPTGSVYTRDDLMAIAEVAVERGVFVISDEIYEELVYDDAEHVSMASLGPEIKRLTITVNGVSKAYSMTGWRIGYAGGDQQVIKAMSKIQSHSTSNPTSISQAASVVALKGTKDFIKMMQVEFYKRREYMWNTLNSMNGITCLKPKGAFYMFPNISRLIGKSIDGEVISNSDTFARILLEKGKVAVVPGSGFGSDVHVRLSYATSMDTIVEGLKRMGELLERAK
jgi:aspartate aminotransferase